MDDIEPVAGLEPNAASIAWCKQYFAMLADGGVWAIKRSGLIFQRRGDRLVYFQRMPWLEEMEGTITPEQLDAQQRREYDINKKFFAAAGIAVEGWPE